MGDSSPPQLHAPAPGATAPSSGGAATRIPRLHPPLRIETVQALPFRRNSNRTSHVDSTDSSMDTPNARVLFGAMLCRDLPLKGSEVEEPDVPQASSLKD